MNDLERQVMEAMLRGDHPTLFTLRAQLAVAKVVGRDLTGVGFFTRFHVPSSAVRLSPPRSPIVADVFATVEGLKHGAGFLLFVTDGVLDTLEGYTLDDRWPDDARLVRVFYMRPQQGSDGPLVETSERDLEWATRSGSERK
jgi:hypothetical protein